MLLYEPWYWYQAPNPCARHSLPPAKVQKNIIGREQEERAAATLETHCAERKNSKVRHAARTPSDFLEYFQLYLLILGL